VGQIVRKTFFHFFGKDMAQKKGPPNVGFEEKKGNFFFLFWGAFFF